MLVPSRSRVGLAPSLIVVAIAREATQPIAHTSIPKLSSLDPSGVSGKASEISIGDGRWRVRSKQC